MKTDAVITARFVALESVLDECQRRLYAAVEAKVLGHSGLKRVHEVTGVARGSILMGLKELKQGVQALDERNGDRQVWGQANNVDTRTQSTFPPHAQPLTLSPPQAQAAQPPPWPRSLFMPQSRRSRPTLLVRPTKTSPPRTPRCAGTTPNALS